MHTTTSVRDRIHAFEHDFARRQADRTLPAPGGFAVRSDAYPGSHEHNRLIVADDADPTEVLAAADAALSDLPFRSVCVDGAPDWADPFAAAGYDTSVELRRGADVTFLAVRGDDGTPRAWCDLYIAAESGIAQVEDMLTPPAWRGRGYARALVTDAVRRAVAAGCDLIFLRADDEDWPKELYRRLGFAPVGRAHGYTRVPAPPADAAADQSYT